MKIVFHIGDMKTGSTAIQKALLQGDLVDPAGERPSYVLAHGIARSVANRPQIARVKIARDVARTALKRSDLLIYSSEFFENVKPSQLARVIAPIARAAHAELQVIGYVRPHVSRLISSFAEQSKKGLFFGTPEAFAKKEEIRERLQYAPRFLAWKREFGSNFTLRPMVRDSLVGGDAVKDFASHVGLVLKDGSNTRSNEKLNVRNLVLLREMQSIMMSGGNASDEASRALGWELAKNLQADQGPEVASLFTKHAMSDLIASFEADAAKMDEEFFPDKVLSHQLAAAIRALPEQSPSLDFHNYFSDETASYVRLMAEFLKSVANPDPDAFAEMVRKRKI